MRWLCIILSTLLLSIFAAQADSRTFTQDELVELYGQAYEKLGGFGSLREEVNTAQHSNFRWKWEVHYINALQTGCSVVLKKCHEATSKGYSYEVYYFVDYDMDGKLDRIWRDYIIVDRTNAVLMHNPPPELHEAITKWKHSIPLEEGQKMYEAELEFWMDKLNDH
jgi:hypothetical protein